MDLEIITWPEFGEEQQSEQEIFADGVAEGYPLCCIWEFLRDNREGLFPAWYRGAQVQGFWNTDVDYVPCLRHARELVSSQKL